MVFEAFVIEGYGDVLADERFAISAEEFDAIGIVDFAEIEIFDAGCPESFVYLEDAGVDEFDFFAALAGDLHLYSQGGGDLSETIRDAEQVNGFAVAEEFEFGDAGGGGEVVEVLWGKVEACAFDF